MLHLWLYRYPSFYKWGYSYSATKIQHWLQFVQQSVLSVEREPGLSCSQQYVRYWNLEASKWHTKSGKFCLHVPKLIPNPSIACWVTRQATMQNFSRKLLALLPWVTNLLDNICSNCESANPQKVSHNSLSWLCEHQIWEKTILAVHKLSSDANRHLKNMKYSQSWYSRAVSSLPPPT